MQTSTRTSETLIGWKSGKTTYFPLSNGGSVAMDSAELIVVWLTPIDNDDKTAYALYILILLGGGGWTTIKN